MATTKRVSPINQKLQYSELPEFTCLLTVQYYSSMYIPRCFSDDTTDVATTRLVIFIL